MEMAAAHVLALIYEGDTSVSALNQSLVRDLARAGGGVVGGGEAGA